MPRLAGFTELSRKIVCVGRNYADHAKELGNKVPSKPVLFMKPPSSYITAGQHIEVPLGCTSLHHEIELGVVIGRQCKRVEEREAMSYVGGYCLALDMTARDFQEEAKSKGLPWAMAKVKRSSFSSGPQKAGAKEASASASRRNRASILVFARSGDRE